MNTLNILQQLNVTNQVITKPAMYQLQPCPESHQRVIQHFQERTVVESLPKTRLFRPTPAPAKPPFLSAVQQLLLRHGFDEKTIRVGITGFGKVKTHLAEIGLVSTKAGFYNLHLGGNTFGTQLNQLYRLHLTETEVLAELGRILPVYKLTRKPAESFGEFVLRKKLI
jgi:hypothetical protein